jgi:TPR repeat protein
MSLPPATISSIPIADYAKENDELADMTMAHYYSCCGKGICKGCIHSFCESGNIHNCPYCKAEIMGKTDDDRIEELMKRVEANDAGAMHVLGSYYDHGQLGLQQDLAKGVELWKQAAKLGSSEAHFALGCNYDEEGDSKKEKFHYEAAAMAGNEAARCKLESLSHSPEIWREL